MAAMTFLQLVNRAITECGDSGGPIATTAGQLGSIQRIINWIGDSWSDIQTEHDDWDWMRSSNILGAGASFVPASGQYTTPLGTGVGQVGIDVDSFGKWDNRSFRSNTTTVGTNDEIYLDDIDFDVWRDSYMYGAMRQVRTRPVAVAFGPDQSVNLGPPPNGLYTITGDYFVAPTVMVADTDTPTGLPTRFNMLIVYKAMMKYAGYESAPEVYSRGSMEYNLMFAQLEAVRLPRMSFSGSL